MELRTSLQPDSSVIHSLPARRLPRRSSPWLAPGGLVIVGLVPLGAGVARLVELGSGSAVTPENARFFASPLPAAIHIVSALAYALVGAFQVSPALLRRHPRWHRAAGRLLAPLGIAAALSGAWLAHFYPPLEHDGPLLYMVRMAAGTAWVSFITLGLLAIRRRDFAAHAEWMLRGYALGMGAGTQVLTHVPWFLLPEVRGELSRALLSGAAWFINLTVAEWVIRRRLEPRGAHRGARGARAAELRGETV